MRAFISVFSSEYPFHMECSPYGKSLVRTYQECTTMLSIQEQVKL